MVARELTIPLEYEISFLLKAIHTHTHTLSNMVSGFLYFLGEVAQLLLKYEEILITNILTSK